MKAFKKWLDENPGRYTIPALKTGWRESLKWLEATATGIELEEGGDGFDIVDLHRIIKEELGEE